MWQRWGEVRDKISGEEATRIQGGGRGSGRQASGREFGKRGASCGERRARGDLRRKGLWTGCGEERETARVSTPGECAAFGVREAMGGTGFWRRQDELSGRATSGRGRFGRKKGFFREKISGRKFFREKAD